MSIENEVIAVITQVDGIISDMKVFTDNSTAEKLYIDTINDYRKNWADSFGIVTNTSSLNDFEVGVACEDGYFLMGDTMFSIVHSSNNINVCAC